MKQAKLAITCICKVYESFQSFLFFFYTCIVLLSLIFDVDSVYSYTFHLQKKSLEIFFFVCASSFALEIAPAPIGSR